MANKTDPAGQFTVNIIKEAIKAFGDVPVSYETLIDLTGVYIYTHVLFINTLDEDVSIKYGDSEFTVQADRDLWMDDVLFNGIVEYKYSSGAPTEGKLQIICH